ncbi:MAG: hypothetical protein B7Z55_14130 [Planctomycetales bacterium 12-60-4]|nr:MAG: hypothetical protein B7Z55_14130 [Planctomycetales bacterium 12-60-4]
MAAGVTSEVAETLPPLPDLSADLATLVAQIPRGCVTSYGDLAEALGDLSAAKWVAVELQREDLTRTGVPVHRVIRRTRELPGKLPDDRERRQRLLRSEGCHFESDARIAAVHLWREFVTTRPLRRLADWQREVAGRVPSPRQVSVPDVVAGVDLSYSSSTSAVAAYVAIEVPTGRVVTQHVCRAATPFPYISGYLTFRELPPLLQLLSEVRQQGPSAEVVLVDGSGILHPRRFGIAVSVGLLAGCTTIGISKHRLCGQVREEPLLPVGHAVWHEDEWRGIATDGGFDRSTLYVSPGCGIDVVSAANIVQAVWTDPRGPAPIALADRISRQTARADQTAKGFSP